MLFVIVIVDFVVLCIVLANAIRWPLPRQEVASLDPVVSVLIPARNEAHHIEEAILSALAQDDLVKEVLVYDDHSNDGTPNIVEALQTRYPKVELLHPRPLEDGWLGKPFACQQLSGAATGEWLLFLDADARLHPGALSKMLGEASARNVTLLSAWPNILALSFWERVFMPMLNFVVFSLFPTPMQHASNIPALGLAHGACLLVRHEEYRNIGGHRRVWNNLFEDTALARVWRECGFHGICLNGRYTVSVRMYTGLREMIEGFAKIAYPAFRYEASFWIFMGFHFIFLLLPVAMLPIALWLPFEPVAVGTAACAVLLARGVHCLQFGYPLWSIIFHPIAEAGLIGLALYARHRCRNGTGIRWKGRTYNFSRA